MARTAKSMQQKDDRNAMVVYAKDRAIFQKRALEERLWYAIDVRVDFRSTPDKPSQIEYIYFHLGWQDAIVYRAKVKFILLCSDIPYLQKILSSKELRKCVIIFDGEVEKIDPIIVRTKGSKVIVQGRKYIYHERVTKDVIYDDIFINKKP